MKLSIVISIYQSYEIVKRQILHFSKMDLHEDDVEFIFVDDGSNPPIEGRMRNLTIVQTNNNLAWTQGLGRNLGASKAKGEYLFMTDIDHIISRPAIEAGLSFNGNKMIFRRKIAVLDENGVITQDKQVLREWGYEWDNLDASVHGNTFIMKKDIFWSLGGYGLTPSLVGYHPASKKGDDCYFNKKWNRAFSGEQPYIGPDIYMFPTGRFNKDGNNNPFGFFHNLSQEKQEKFYKNE